MKNLFCDFALAKILDELGFKEKCLGTYLGFGNGEKREDNNKIYKTTEPELFISGQFPSSEDKEEELQLGCFGFCHAPTWWQIKEWLWNQHNIKINVAWSDEIEPDYNLYLISAANKSKTIPFYDFPNNIRRSKGIYESAIVAEIDGIKKIVEYLYEQHHKTKAL